MLDDNFSDEQLKLLLTAQNGEMRRKAINALGRIQSARAKKLLIDLLNHDDDQVREHAIFWLGWNKEISAIPELRKAMKSDNINISLSALHSLEKMESSTITDIFLEDLLNPIIDERVRIEVARALGQINDVRASRILIKVVETVENSPYFRYSATLALSKYTKSKDINSLIKILVNSKEDDIVRAGIAKALGKLNAKDALPLLRSLLFNSSTPIQDAVIEAIGFMRDVVSIPTLVSLLETVDNQTKIVIIEALGKIGFLDNYSKLLADDDPDIRVQVIESIALNKDRRFFDNLIEILISDQDGFVRSRAAYALGQMHLSAAIPYLIDALRDRNADIRFRVVEALGELKAEQSLGFLEYVAQYDDGETTLGESVAEAALKTINVIQDK